MRYEPARVGDQPVCELRFVEPVPSAPRAGHGVPSSARGARGVVGGRNPFTDKTLTIYPRRSSFLGVHSAVHRPILGFPQTR